MEGGDWKNALYFGDHLEVLRVNAPSESVDLIYLDPPFNSNANYNVLVKEKGGEKSARILTWPSSRTPHRPPWERRSRNPGIPL
jgi:16S rRNA G966 N2-methylase RsmD